MMIFPTKPSRSETLWGGIYLFLYLFVLSWLIPLACMLLKPELDGAQINFIYFGVNFAATTVIFHKYLIQSLKDALRVVFPTIRYALLGYLGSMFFSSIVVSAIMKICPDFANVNNQSIAGLVDQNLPLMAIGAVFLAPVAEELLFRGLVFRGLYDRSPLAAQCLTMVLFSAIHVVGYLGAYDPKVLFFCFLQYLVPACCLNFAYQRSGTIVSPILMHMATNLVALMAMR